MNSLLKGRFLNRMLRAARLDASVYEEVEADRGALAQAAAAVVISSVAAGFGVLGRGGLAGGIFSGTLTALAGWTIWAVLIYLIGARLLPEPETKSGVAELLRTLGFASSPGIIRVLGIIPGSSDIVFLVATVWMAAATVVAARQALDYRSTFRAAVVCVIALLVQLVIVGLLFYLILS
jgi:hypothetical protein